MEAIMIITVIAIFFINFIFIDNIYKIVDKTAEPALAPNEKSDGSLREALVLGDDDTCQKIEDLLKTHNISSDIIKCIDDINKSHPYKYVLAVFNDDLENLTVCSIAVKIMGINNVVAICNKEYNQKIYDENNILTINRYASAFDIVSILLNNQNKREA